MKKKITKNNLIFICAFIAIVTALAVTIATFGRKKENLIEVF